MFKITTWSIVLYLVVIAIIVLGFVLIKIHTNKVKREARQRGLDESLRLKKRQARRLLNTHQLNFNEDTDDEQGRDVLNSKRG